MEGIFVHVHCNTHGGKTCINFMLQYEQSVSFRHFQKDNEDRCIGIARRLILILLLTLKYICLGNNVN